MGRKKRGREKLETCCACGAKVPRNKAVFYNKRVSYGTEMKGSDDVSVSYIKKQVYCVSCAKHRKIYEKKKKAAARRRERY